MQQAIRNQAWSERASPSSFPCRSTRQDLQGGRCPAAAGSSRVGGARAPHMHCHNVLSPCTHCRACCSCPACMDTGWWAWLHSQLVPSNQGKQAPMPLIPTFPYLTGSRAGMQPTQTPRRVP